MIASEIEHGRTIGAKPRRLSDIDVSPSHGQDSVNDAASRSKGLTYPNRLDAFATR